MPPANGSPTTLLGLTDAVPADNTAIIVPEQNLRISYAQLLAIYATVAHDPTQVNRQGPDVGPSYRSAIFPQNAAQRQAAARFLGRLRASRRYSRPIATRIESGAFYPAEASHQDFMRRNPYHPYILVHDRPKLAKLKRSYPQLWKA